MKIPFRIVCSFLLVPWIIALIVGSFAYGEDPVRVAIFPFQFHAKESLDYLQDAIFVTLSGRLLGEGDIEVVDRGAVRDALPRQEVAQISGEMARRIAADLDADYAIVGNLTKVGEFVNVDARLISIERPGPPVAVASQYRGLEDAMEGLGEFADRVRRRILLASPTPLEDQKKPEPSDKSTIAKVLEGVRGEKPSPPQPARGLESIQTLPTLLKGVDVGDVDGDGQNEIVLIDARTLWIYKQTGGRLRLFRKIEGHRNDRFLTLDVADVNRNGFSEIIVSNIRQGALHSFILEFEEKRIKKISDRDRWFYRVINRPTQGWTLVGQKMAIDRRPFGPIYPFAFKGKTFHPEKDPLLKKEVPVFGFGVGDVEGRGEASIIYMDYHDRLRVLNREEAFRWESGTRYGGSDIYYSYGKTGPDVKETRLYIPPRVLVKDLDGDGTSEVMVSQNIFKLNMVERLRGYDRGKIVNLAWRGLGFSESWWTPEISGYISDYQLKDVDNDGRDEIVMTAVSKGILRSGASSSVLVYELF